MYSSQMLFSSECITCNAYSFCEHSKHKAGKSKRKISSLNHLSSIRAFFKKSTPVNTLHVNVNSFL